MIVAWEAEDKIHEDGCASEATSRLRDSRAVLGEGWPTLEVLGCEYDGAQVAMLDKVPDLRRNRCLALAHDEELADLPGPGRAEVRGRHHVGIPDPRRSHYGHGGRDVTCLDCPSRARRPSQDPSPELSWKLSRSLAWCIAMGRPVERGRIFASRASGAAVGETPVIRQPCGNTRGSPMQLGARPWARIGVLFLFSLSLYPMPPLIHLMCRSALVNMRRASRKNEMMHKEEAMREAFALCSCHSPGLALSSLLFYAGSSSAQACHSSPRCTRAASLSSSTNVVRLHMFKLVYRRSHLHACGPSPRGKCPHSRVLACQ